MAGGALDIFDAAMIAAAAGPASIRRWGPSNRPGCSPRLRSESGSCSNSCAIGSARALPAGADEGPDGPFARFATTEGLARLELGPEHAPWDRGHLVAERGMRRIIASSPMPTCAAGKPLFLMPTGAWMACRTLFAALRDGSVTREEIWWFLIRSAQDAQPPSARPGP